MTRVARFALFDASGNFLGRTYFGPPGNRPAAQSGEVWREAQGPIEYAPPEPSIDAQWHRVRAERAARLAACDWVVLRAADQGQPVPAAWQAYRQALRDVTEQPNPAAIVWPKPPAH